LEQWNKNHVAQICVSDYLKCWRMQGDLFSKRPQVAMGPFWCHTLLLHWFTRERYNSRQKYVAFFNQFNSTKFVNTCLWCFILLLIMACQKSEKNYFQRFRRLCWWVTNIYLLNQLDSLRLTYDAQIAGHMPFAVWIWAACCTLKSV